MITFGQASDVTAKPSEPEHLRSSRTLGADDLAMQKFSLEALARELLGRAAAAGGQHTAQTVVGGHERVLRQTDIAMIGGSC